MKKKFFGLFAFAICFMLIFSGCGIAKLDGISERAIPSDGYKLVTTSYVDFYVPESWESSSMSGTISVYVDNSTNSNISVGVQNFATNLKKEKKSTYKKLYESLGYDVNIITFGIMDFCGEEMLYIYQTVSAYGMQIEQWQFMVSKNNSTIAITLTKAANSTVNAETIHRSILIK